MTSDHNRQPWLRSRGRSLACTLLIAACLCLGPAGPFAADSPDRPRRILVIPSYNFDYKGSLWFLQGVMAEFTEHKPFKVTFSHENLQLATHPSDRKYMDSMAASLKIKYSAEKPDLIIVQYRQALQFIEQYGKDIFDEVPIVFAGLSVEGFIPDSLPDHYTGIIASFSATKNIELILNNHPNVRKIYVVGGSSPVEKTIVDEAIRESAPYRGKAEFIALTDMTFPALLAKLETVGDDSAIMYQALQLDAAGGVFVPAQAAIEISRAARVPVYGMLDTYMGSGITGGFLINHDGLGRRAAEIGIEVLQGKNTIERQLQSESIGSYRFDGRQLQRWGIKENKLPEGSKIEFIAFSVWDSYKYEIVGGVCLILLQTLLIAGLLRNRHNRIKTEKKLLQSEELYRVLIENIPQAVLLKDSESKYVSINTAYALAFELHQEEVIGKSDYDFHPKDSADKFRQQDQLVMETAEAMEFDEEKIQNGKKRFYHKVKVPVRDGMGKIVGVLSALTDITERRKAEEALKYSEERHRRIIESLSDSILLRSSEGIIIYANPAALKLLRANNQADLIGKRYVDLVHPDDRALTVERVKKTMDGNWTATLREHRILALDGQVVHVESIGGLVKQRDEVHIFGVFRDITERKRSEEAIIENEKKYRSLVENINDALFTLNIQGLFTYMSPVIKGITGYPPEELIGQSFSRFIFQDDLPTLMERFHMILAAESIGPADYRIVTKTGEVRWVRSSSQPVMVDGKTVAIQGLIRDITQRKRAEEALQESESRLRAIAESAQDAILMMDPKGNISFWNQAAERLLGYTSEETIGQNLHKLIVPQQYYAAHDAAFPRFQETGQGGAIGKTLELGARRKDGAEILVELSLSAVYMNGWHAVGLLRDITQRKQAENELRDTNLQLEEATARANSLAAQAEMASAAKSEFLANMSHEIRTPMNGVIGMTGLLLDTELNEEQRRYAEIVRASGESLLGLINDILDFSKIEAKKLDLETLDFDLSSLLDDFAATMAVRAHEKGLELLCAADPAVPTLLRGDPGRLRQILTNLTGNALKFTHAGEVAIRVAQVEDSEHLNPEPRTLTPSVLLRFSVRDTGIGIPAAKLGLLFDKFSQVDASTTRQYGGTGLGLAISKQLAELMGGAVGVNSEEGKSSEFWFTARLGKQAERVPAESRPPADLRNVRVLIVDDNATSREILTTRLTSWGMRPAESQDGPGALQALYRALDEHDPFRIAVIDMQMPGMDGEALGRAIKADKRLADTRMVMLTSLGIRGDARRFQENGFAAYATKPLRHPELKVVLSLALKDREGTELTPQPIVTRHTAREMLNRFADRKARILLAEDNITNQQVALGILKKMGLRADAVANGAEAVKALETIPYDLVLMDVQMPVMDGFEATRRIRELEAGSKKLEGRHPSPSAFSPQPSAFLSIPIIAMTAHAMQGDRERCLEAGMNDYVTKPVSPQALAEVLDKWLPKKAIQKEL